MIVNELKVVSLTNVVLRLELQCLIGNRRDGKHKEVKFPWAALGKTNVYVFLAIAPNRFFQILNT